MNTNNSQPCFLQPTNMNLPVWRYLDLSKFVHLLSRNVLTLSRLDKFIDPFEGSLPAPTLEKLQQIYNTYDVSQERRDKSTDIRRRTRTRTYANCWNLGDAESDALWRLYCGNSQGVAIRTTYTALQNSLRSYPDVYIGLIRYINYDKDFFVGDDFGIFDLVMHKQVAFAHEREVRVVWLDTYEPRFASLDGSGEERPVVKSLEWNAEQVIQAIHIHPCAHELFEEVVRDVTDKFAPVLSTKIQWSALKRPPQY